ncbi:hypothetical protein, partial [Streptomyces sporangiiformans]|uniref:hypothetical protein n=1 Tax=Streptomyces sporangiiformans TaxID=2315329 RepID=UPI0019690788
MFDPFDDATYTYPIASASVTNGGNRPPDWALAPDGLTGSNKSFDLVTVGLSARWSGREEETVA